MYLYKYMFLFTYINKSPNLIFIFNYSKIGHFEGSVKDENKYEIK